jgi:hypothetical protein
LDLVYEMPGGEFVGRFRELPGTYASTYQLRFFYAKIGDRVKWTQDKIIIDPSVLVPSRMSRNADLELPISNWTADSFLEAPEFFKSLGYTQKASFQVADFETFRAEKSMEDGLGELLQSSNRVEIIATTRTWVLGQELMIEGAPFESPFVSAVDSRRVLIREARVGQTQYSNLARTNAIYIPGQGVRIVETQKGLGINFKRSGFSAVEAVRGRCKAFTESIK